MPVSTKKQSDPNALLLTINDAAGLMSVCRKTVYNLLNARELDSIKRGRIRRITRASVDRWILNNQEY